jgi:mannose-6-phosphate isomerase-like protein (cupin superfamily)
MKQISLSQLPEQGVSHNVAIRKKVFFQSGEIPHLNNFAQARFAPGQIATAHAHSDMCEVFLVEAGEGTISINTIAYPLYPGQCIAVEVGELHEVANTGEEDLIVTYFGLRVEPK